MKKIITFGLFVFLGLAIGGTALAGTAGEQIPTEFGTGIPNNITSGAQFVGLLRNITNWIFVVLMVASVIFIVLAAWQFVAGGGEPQQVSQARQKLLYAAIGIIVALLARGIVAAIINIVQG